VVSKNVTKKVPGGQEGVAKKRVRSGAKGTDVKEWAWFQCRVRRKRTGEKKKDPKHVPWEGGVSRRVGEQTQTRSVSVVVWTRNEAKKGRGRREKKRWSGDVGAAGWLVYRGERLERVRGMRCAGAGAGGGSVKEKGAEAGCETPWLGGATIGMFVKTADVGARKCAGRGGGPEQGKEVPIGLLFFGGGGCRRKDPRDEKNGGD